MMKVPALLLVLIALSAATSCVENAGDAVISGAGWIVGIAAMLMALVIAALYMYGNATSNANAIVIAKDELYHLGFSLLLLLGISGIIASSCVVTNSFFSLAFQAQPGMQNYYQSCGGDSATPGELQSCSINLAISDANKITSEYSRINIATMMSSSWFYTYAVPFSDMVTTVASAYKRTYALQLETIENTFMIPILASLQMQKLLVGIFSRYSIELILPVGFVFRLIPPMRKFGNFMLALAFGLYVVIPFFTTFNYFMYSQVRGLCSSYKSIMGDVVLDSSGTDFGYGTACAGSHGFWRVAMLIPQAFFLPNLTIALFVTFLSAINKALSVVG